MATWQISHARNALAEAGVVGTLVNGNFRAGSQPEKLIGHLNPSRLSDQAEQASERVEVEGTAASKRFSQESYMIPLVEHNAKYRRITNVTLTQSRARPIRWKRTVIDNNFSAPMS
jgi:hypothetical protein